MPLHYDDPIILIGPGTAATAFSYTAVGNATRLFYGSRGETKGKLYVEFNCGSLQDAHYRFGFVAPGHVRVDPTSDGTLPGDDSQSWAMSTETGDLHHAGTTVDPGTPIDYIAVGSRLGVYYNYQSDFFKDGGIMRWAVDFDAGKMWAGYYDSQNSKDHWHGDPVAGTSPSYTFAPNTHLTPVVGVKYGSFPLPVAYGQLAANLSTQRASPPSGFSRWEEFPNWTEVLADAPYGYWLAGPTVEGTAFYNSIGIAQKEVDISGNRRHCRWYNQTSYSVDYGGDATMLPAQVRKGFYGAGDTDYSLYPISQGAGSPFTVACTVRIEGAGLANSADWKGGNMIFCNHFDAPERNLFTVADLWFGLSLRDRRLRFGVGSSEVVSASDLSDGSYHVACVLNVSAGTLTLYVNGAQSAQTTGYTSGGQSAVWMAVGSSRPTVSGGKFPGYIRDVSYHRDSALTGTRVAAHASNLNSAPLPLPIRSLVDSRMANFPFWEI